MPITNSTMVAEPEATTQPTTQTTSTFDANECVYGAFRNGRLVSVAWHELTDGERRDAYCNMFAIYEVL